MTLLSIFRKFNRKKSGKIIHLGTFYRKKIFSTAVVNWKYIYHFSYTHFFVYFYYTFEFFTLLLHSFRSYFNSIMFTENVLCFIYFIITIREFRQRFACFLNKYFSLFFRSRSLLANLIQYIWYYENNVNNKIFYINIRNNNTICNITKQSRMFLYYMYPLKMRFFLWIHENEKFLYL